MKFGSNSDLILENTITGNLQWTIEEFAKRGEGRVTFPTKFDMVDELLNLDHQGKITIRMSVNPEEIINKVEFGTSRLKNRVDALNKICDAGYKVGILVAPIVLVDNWKILYADLIEYLYNNLSNKVKNEAFFEVISLKNNIVKSP